MILTVHDELVFEAREDAADEIAALVREKMSGAATLARAPRRRRRRREELEGRKELTIAD